MDSDKAELLLRRPGMMDEGSGARQGASVELGMRNLQRRRAA